MNRTLLRQAAILAAFTFAVFSPTLSADFVYDARLQILTDPFPHDPRNWPAVLSFAVLGMDVLDFNRPVHLASIMLDAALWGRDPFGYHLTSILLHCLNVVLLWLVLRDLLPRGRDATDAAVVPATGITAIGVAAFAGAVLFAVHPIVAEAVCEPTYREDLLVACFTLAAIVLASRATPVTRRIPWPAVGAAACCLLAAASKESGIATPLVLAAYWWLFRRGTDRRLWSVMIGGGTALAAAFMAARFLLEPAESRIFEHPPAYPGGSLAAAMQLEPRILALYVQLVAFPVNLCADYGGTSIDHLPTWLALGILAPLAAALTWAGWRDRRIAFGTALMLLPLVPVSNLVPIYRAAADRYLYVPLAGVAVIVACVVAAGWSRLQRDRRQILLVVGMAVLGILTAACIARQRVWSDQLALWLDTSGRNPTSYTAASGLAGAFRNAGRFVESERAARHAVALSDATRGDAWLTLALALEGQGRAAEADEALAKAIEQDPRLADPDKRVAALAMDLEEAEGVRQLLARRNTSAAGTTPAEP